MASVRRNTARPEKTAGLDQSGTKIAPGVGSARYRGQGRYFCKLSLAICVYFALKSDKKPCQIWLYRLSHGCCFSRLTRREAEAYIPPIGAPFRKLRLDGAPLKLLTGSVKMPPIVFGSMSFDDALRDLAGGKWGFRTPGCLTSKSEERETWTAGSLRTAVAWRSNSSRCM